MPTVHIYMLEGRSIEQKRELVKRVTDAVNQSIRPTRPVNIFIHDVTKQNYAEAGALVLDQVA